MRTTKHKLWYSALSLLLCLALLMGTTFAWFTDSVTSANNIITAGNLDLEMYWTDDPDSGVWHNVEDAAYNTIFSYDNWEPGYTDVKYVKLVNAGDLALNYQLMLTPESGVGKLAEVINVFYAEGAVDVDGREDLSKLGAVGLLDNVLENAVTANGTLLAEGQVSPLHPSGEVIVTVAMSMITSAGNEYQNESVGNFTVTALATQCPFEQDSFGSDYDSGASFPQLIRADKAFASVNAVDGKVPAGGVSMQGNKVSATVPAGVKLADGVSELKLTVTPLENTTSGIVTVNNEMLIPVDVHIEGVAQDNDVPVIIDLGAVLPPHLNMGNYVLIHVENGANSVMTAVADRAQLTEHNRFTYDPVTGEVSVAMASFSEIALLSEPAQWKGGRDCSWYDASKNEFEIANADQLAGFGAIVGGMDGQTRDSFVGKTVKLTADIDLGDGETSNNPDAIFYPIGYNSDDGKYEKTGVAITSSLKTFEGTFDGQGHTVSNFYHNTWEMKGDNEYYAATEQYYREGMGLFGRVYKGTVKNLTVKNFSSDGEYTTTGCIAAYADGATFENIAIIGCNPRVYNIGNGGIVGCVGWYAKEADLTTTFKNITVDNTNKISALWGSYDVACGGIVGQYYPTSGQTSAGKPTNGGVDLQNCHVSAQMDVYNDVCANYQYYAYRYAGMIIGSVRENTVNEDGKTIPKMDGITAKGCTVNYGTWNDYYYCELVDNSLASYTHDHQFSRLVQVKSVDKEAGTYVPLGGTESVSVPASGRANYVVVEGAHATENATCYHFKDGKVWKHEDAGTEMVGGKEVLKEDKHHYHLPFYQLFTGYGWGVNSIGLEKYSGITTNLGIAEGDQQESVEKFKKKFNGDFLYRVGNGNAVSLGNLFEAAPDVKINIDSIWVAIDKISDDSNVSGSFTANATDWTKGTLQFSGTGVVKITIQDYQFCTPTVLYLEVVDAVNATGATNATANNVVLLKDCGFNELTVSGGYALYGNGFTMTRESDVAALNMGYAFVTLDNGTLDNVQIVCPNFDLAVLYSDNMTSGNRSEVDGSKTRYYNVKSGVMASGNSQILNSRLSGGRAALNITGGNVVVDNSRIELGAVASLLVGAANSVTLRDVTLLQKPTPSTYDSSKVLMGFSALFICDENGDAAPVTLEGTLVQYAWADANDAQYVPSAGQSIVSTVMGKTAYLHDIDGDGTNESLNLGFAYMPHDVGSPVNGTSITDNRTNKSAVPYDYVEVPITAYGITIGTTYVYSYKNSNGTVDAFKIEPTYSPNRYSDIIKAIYGDAADGLTTGKSYSADGWVYELNVDLDKLSGYAVDFSKLTMSVNGVTVTDFTVNGGAKPTSPVAVTAGGVTYTLMATVDGKTYTATFKVTGTETSKESPSLVEANYEAGVCVASSYGGTWSGAAPALQGIKIKYWSVAEKQYKTITLSDYTPTTKGQLNGTNTTWTYSPANGDFTLTLTGGQVHSSNKVNAMPVVCDGKLYFVAAKSSGLVNSGNSARAVPVSYSFKDNNNGDVLTFSHTWSVAENKDAQYKYDDFCSGTMTQLKASGGGGCVTPDTLITLADGSKKAVSELTGKEMLLVWNMETGKLDFAPIMFIDTDPAAQVKVIKLGFSDGTEVKVITEHGFWDYDLNRYVYLDENAAQYIGHTFAKQNGAQLTKVKLTSVVIEQKLSTAWSPVTAGHLCYFTNDMLSMPGGVGGLFNIFEVDAETMTYDYEAMAKDIETYGLFTYEEMNAIAPLSEEMFNAAGGQYLKVSIGKGNLTVEELAAMIERYSKYI